MRKMYALISIVLLFALVSCGNRELKRDNADSGTIMLDDYLIDVLAYAIDKDDYGKSIIAIKYGFTNNSDVANSFWGALTYNAYQNGISLSRSYNYRDANEELHIKSGASLEVIVVYEMINETDDVELELQLGGSTFYWGGDADKVITRTIRIAD